jgi:hypothetical protein
MAYTQHGIELTVRQESRVKENGEGQRNETPISLSSPMRCGRGCGMTEIKDCLPEGARRHFINLRNIRLGAETARYRERLTELRAQLAAKGQGRSGWQEMEEWKYKEELSDEFATGYIQDAIETCDLYEIPLTEPLCECLAKATEELLNTQYQHALQAQAQGVSDVKIPFSACWLRPTKNWERRTKRWIPIARRPQQVRTIPRQPTLFLSPKRSCPSQFNVSVTSTRSGRHLHPYPQSAIPGVRNPNTGRRQTGYHSLWWL